MKTPPDILEKFEKASIGLDYGTATLTFSVKQGRQRYIIAREESILCDEEPSTHTEIGEKTTVRCIVSN